VNIQDVAESALEEHLRIHNADHGCVAVMEVATGEIKAIANLSKTPSGEYSEEFNYAIAEAASPGSTMKLLSFMAAMDDGYVDVNDMVEVGYGEHYFFGQRMKDSHPPKKSRMSLKEVFMESSNVGTSKLIYNAYAKRPQQFVDKLHSFGMNEQLGLQIEGEGKPRIKVTTDKDWSSVSLPWMSIGYEVKITPLQMLTFYNAVANNGRMVKPKFVKEIRHHGQVIESYPTEVIRDSIASASTILKAQHLLELVVDSGTAKSLRNPNYKVAGKTGTAQIHNPKYGYDRSQMTYQASFAGYFPAEAPKYSIIAVVYAPSSGFFYGGAVAAPIFKEVADKIYANRLDMHKIYETDSTVIALPFAKAGHHKDLSTVLANLNIEADFSNAAPLWNSIQQSEKELMVKARKMENGLVPNVMGMGVRDALYLLENSGMTVRVNGRGLVTKQSITPGTRIMKGQQIVIELG
jgi:cell division protein FtsI (penicillin-binding protein 3)